MDIKKMAPWNWFAKEEESHGNTVPVRHGGASDHDTPFDPPRHLFNRLHREMEAMIDSVFRGFGPLPPAPGWPSHIRMGGGPLRPTLDICAAAADYTITVEIPGVAQENVQLDLSGDTLTISGEKRQEREEKERNYHRVERIYGSFQRILSLPEDADRDRITATFDKGLLVVTIPRAPLPGRNVRRIEIKSAD
jgi:HSP20 family protein